MTRAVALSGLYPRSERLVKATWDFDKGLLDQDRLRAVYLEDARRVVALQERLGFSSITDGNLTWQDPFRGLVDSTTGFEAGGLVRFFETNKFIRQPILSRRPVLDRERFAAHFLLENVKAKGPKKAILPSPYWLLRSAKIETPANAPEDALIAGLVNEAAKWAESKGYTTIQFQEPLLFYEKGPDLDLARELLSTASKGLKATTVVNFPNGDASRNYAWATGLAFDWIGIDFVETHVEQIKGGKKTPKILAQVIDSQESLAEDPKELGTLAATIEKRLKPKELAFTHTWELDFLPADVAERKLELLAGAVLEEAVA